MRTLLLENVDLEFRRDYLSLDCTVAISAEGSIFKIGDEVCHEGSAMDGETATITKFTVDMESMDIQAHTEKGCGRICFMYLPE